MMVPMEGGPTDGAGACTDTVAGEGVTLGALEAACAGHAPDWDAGAASDSSMVRPRRVTNLA